MSSGMWATRGRRVTWLVGVVILVGVVVAYLLLRQTSSPAQRVADAQAPPPAVATGQIQDRVLRAAVTLQGSVTAGSIQSVGVPGVGSGEQSVVTDAAPEVGTKIKAGQLLFAVSDRPVFVLEGSLPLYRNIVPGVSGPDVAALQSGLENAGYSVSDRSGFYGWSTQQAVKALWSSAGFTPPRPEGIDDRLDAARQAVAAAPDGAAHARAIKALHAVQADDGPVVSLGSIAMITQLPAEVVTSHAPVGATLSGGTPVALAWGSPMVTLDATGAQTIQIRPGAPVTIHLSDGSTVAGTVSASGTPATGTGSTGGPSASPDGSGTGTPGGAGAMGGSPSPGSANAVPSMSGSAGSTQGSQIIVKPVKPLPAAAVGRPVSAEIVTGTTGHKVLAVPVSAIRVNDDGSHEVIVIDGAKRRSVRVEVGVNIGGWVQITDSDPALQTGDKVVVGSGR